MYSIDMVNELHIVKVQFNSFTGVCCCQYLKSDFKLHFQENNSCPDHCWTYALSPKDSCNHPHDVHCEICDDLRLLLNEVEFSISSVDTKYK